MDTIAAQIAQGLGLLMPLVIFGLGALWRKLGTIDSRLNQIGERLARVETILDERAE